MNEEQADQHLRDMVQPLYPWQKQILEAIASGQRLTVNVPRRYGLSEGPRLAHRLDVDLMTGRVEHQFTVIIDDPEAPFRKPGSSFLDGVQAHPDYQKAVDAHPLLDRWEDDGGRG